MLPAFTPSLQPTSWDLRRWVFKSQQSMLGQPKALAGEFYSLSSGYKNRVLGDIVECGLEGARHDADVPDITSGFKHDVSVSAQSTTRSSWGN